MQTALVLEQFVFYYLRYRVRSRLRKMQSGKQNVSYLWEVQDVIIPAKSVCPADEIEVLGREVDERAQAPVEGGFGQRPSGGCDQNVRVENGRHEVNVDKDEEEVGLGVVVASVRSKWSQEAPDLVPCDI